MLIILNKPPHIRIAISCAASSVNGVELFSRWIDVNDRIVPNILIQIHPIFNWIPAQEPPQGVAIVPCAVVLEAGFGIRAAGR